MTGLNMINNIIFKKHAPKHHFAVAKVFFSDEKFYMAVSNPDL